MSHVAIPERPKRQFLDEAFQITTWEALKPYFDRLLAVELNSLEALRGWLQDRSELEAAISEDLGWRYIRMTCHTDNQEYGDRYQQFIQHIQPHIAPIADALNRKAAACPFLDKLRSEPGYDILIRNLRKDIEIFREANVPLFTEISTESQRYAQLSGDMTIQWKGQELTLQQASVMLLETDRQVREEVYKLITARRLKDKEVLDELYTKLIGLRHQVAVNAGFKNFRDYMFKSYGRFDYTPQNCFDFHDAISAEVVPLLEEIAELRKDDLKVDKLRPWDKAVDALGRAPLKAFDGGADLIGKSIECFHRLNPYLGECLTVMKEMGHLDLESRKGKAPGGYNYPLPEIGVPFIFMNATSTMRDMTTLMHEGGHAVHNFVTKDLSLADFKNPPMEVAELASMSMELISMDHWDVFFRNPEDLVRARQEQLEDIIETLPWVATIDKFQHWVYEHPDHALTQRRDNWHRIYQEFADTVTDWEGLTESRDFLWQKQLHLFEVPFYYIEYGMAQLGAIAMWRNYRQDPKKGLEGYLNALRQGNLQSIPEIYKAGGIRFDFSRPYVAELMRFVRKELGL